MVRKCFFCEQLLLLFFPSEHFSFIKKALKTWGIWGIMAVVFLVLRVRPFFPCRWRSSWCRYSTYSCCWCCCRCCCCSIISWMILKPSVSVEDPTIVKPPSAETCRKYPKCAREVAWVIWWTVPPAWLVKIHLSFSRTVQTKSSILASLVNSGQNVALKMCWPNPNL